MTQPTMTTTTSKANERLLGAAFGIAATCIVVLITLEQRKPIDIEAIFPEATALGEGYVACFIGHAPKASTEAWTLPTTDSHAVDIVAAIREHAAEMQRSDERE